MEYKMIKSVVAIIILLLGFTITKVQSEPSKNIWYIGTKLNYFYSSLKDIKNILFKNNPEDNTTVAIFPEFLTGYQFNPNLSFELSYYNIRKNFYDNLELEKKKKISQKNAFDLSAKFTYPIFKKFGIYSRLGGRLFFNPSVDSRKIGMFLEKNKNNIKPVFAIGLEYKFSKQISARIDYSWKKDSFADDEYYLNINNPYNVINFDLTWNFLPKNKKCVYFFKPKKIIQDQYFKFKENILFPFNSSKIEPHSYDLLEKLCNKMKKIRIKKVFIFLKGYTDSVGKDSCNKKLSEARMQSVKKYFQKGNIKINQIITQNFGKKEPITNQVCNDIKNRSILISCLAPDRRVEVSILAHK